MHLLLSFDNEPNSDGTGSIREQEHAQISTSLTMIAFESIVKVKLHDLDSIDPKDYVKLFNLTLDDPDHEDRAFILWTELRILRNHIIHGAYFQTSSKGGIVSRETEKTLQSRHYSKFINRDEECTINWHLRLNPLSIYRYEALTALLFFYWYGQNSKVWKSNVPLHDPYTDVRMRYSFKNKWFNRGDYYRLLGHHGDFIKLLGFLTSRLNSIQQKMFCDLCLNELGIDMQNEMRIAHMIIEMPNNTSINEE